MAQTQKITIGTISHGTLRVPDLLEIFADELERLDSTADAKRLCDDARKSAAFIESDSFEELEEHHQQREYDESSEILAALEDALNECAWTLPFVYFGAHEGDGSDFGFWPDWDALQSAADDGELEVVRDPSEVREGVLTAFYNDHGNLTLYGEDRKPLWDCV